MYKHTQHKTRQVRQDEILRYLANCHRNSYGFTGVTINSIARGLDMTPSKHLRGIINDLVTDGRILEWQLKTPLRSYTMYRLTTQSMGDMQIWIL